MIKNSTIPGISKPVSKIVLGTMIISDENKEKSFELIDAAIANGINTFDTAWVYGGSHSEKGIGLWLKERGNREEVVIISKGCHPSDRKRLTPEDLYSDFNDSMTRLGFDYIDGYMFHRDNPEVSPGPVVEAMNKLISEGKLKAYGGSNWTHQRIQEANEYAEKCGLIPFTMSSPNYGLAEQVENPWGEGCISISGPQNADARDWYIKTNMPVFAYSSLARGLFSGRVTRENYNETCDRAAQTAYCHEVNFQRLDRVRELAEAKGFSVAQIALAFILHSPVNVFPLVGAASAMEIEANIAALNITLSQDELDYLDLEKDEQPLS